jgi:hypothetical protein
VCDLSRLWFFCLQNSGAAAKKMVFGWKRRGGGVPKIREMLTG